MPTATVLRLTYLWLFIVQKISFAGFATWEEYHFHFLIDNDIMDADKAKQHDESHADLPAEGEITSIMLLLKKRLALFFYRPGKNWNWNSRMARSWRQP